MAAGVDLGGALAYAAFAPVSAPRTSTAAASPVMLVFGDSLAYGYMATPGHGWVDDVARALAARDPAVRVANFAVCGARIRQVLAQIDRAPPGPARVIVLVAGANDLMLAVDPLTVARDERHVLERLRTRYPAARIIVANVPDLSWRSFHFRSGAPPEPLPWLPRAGLARLTDVDNAIVTRLVARSGDEVLDLHALTVHDGALAARYISSDGLHPNDLGYAEIARVAWPTIAAAAGACNRSAPPCHAERSPAGRSRSTAGIRPYHDDVSTSPAARATLNATRAAPRIFVQRYTY